MVVCMGENGGDTMTDEQRAHDFAIEIIKMWFAVNKDLLETDGDNSKIVPTDKLAQIYSAAYDMITEG